MTNELVNFVLGIWLLASFGLLVKDSRSWLVMVTGAFVTIAGTFMGLEFTQLGEAQHSSAYTQFGQAIIVFASVAGGALASTAFAELRASRLK